MAVSVDESGASNTMGLASCLQQAVGPTLMCTHPSLEAAAVECGEALCVGEAWEAA